MLLQMISKTQIITLLLVLCLQSAFSQQRILSGKVVDAHNKQPLDSTTLYMYSNLDLDYKFTVTDSGGNFRFDSLKSGTYTFNIFKKGYKSGSQTVITSKLVEEKVFELSHLDSITESPQAHFKPDENFHGGFAINFINPDMNPDVFGSSFNLEWLVSEKTTFSNFYKIGYEFIPLKIAYHYLNNDSIITQPVYKKEYYFALYTGLTVYNRFVFSKQKRNDHPGLFLDFGVGYQLPYTYRYIFKDGSNKKSIIKKLHRFNEFTSFARIGFGVISIKSSYRLIDEITKNNHLNPPRFKIGIEIQSPE